MDLAAPSSPALPARRFVLLWALVLAVAAAAALVPALPPGGTAHLARDAGIRMLGGDFALGWAELGAVAAVAAWTVGKPMLVVGAILWLELRFGPAAGAKNYLLAWTAQTLVTGLFLAVMLVLSMAGLLPEPLISAGEAGGAAELLLVSVPALLLSLIVADFLGYWLHRAQHRFALLWRFHRLHHSLDVDVLHDIAHPVDQLGILLGATLPTMALVGVADGQLYLLVAFTALQGHLNHTRLPIHFGPLGGTLFSDNRYHFVHHSRDPAFHNRNFAGRFPLLDMVFGTYAPRGAGLAETGLADEAAPRTLAEYLTVKLPARRAPR